MALYLEYLTGYTADIYYTDAQRQTALNTLSQEP